jgi:hypothetical protein
MTFKSYRTESRIDWGTSKEGNLALEQINCGAMLRIADATEAMAKNHITLMKERDKFESWYKQQCGERARLERANAALRGHITRLKAKVYPRSKP